MSNAHPSNSGDPSHATHEVHEGPIKTPKQLIWAIVASFLIPITLAIMLANFVASGKRPAAGSQSMDAAAVAQRIAPVGRVEIKDASDMASLKTGEQVYNAQCMVCHAQGVAGSPKIGDAAAWGPRIKTGYEALLNSALKGKGSMAAQGGGDFNDIEIGRAVVYMANQAGGKLDEPKAPAAAAPAAAATAAAPAPAPTATPAAAPAPAVAAAATAATAVAAAAPKVEAKADTAPPSLYTQICAACHIAGVANAPKLGDKAAWEPRLAAGVDGLTASVLKGKGVMPAKGGAATATDAEIKAAVSYMVSQVK